MALGPGQVRVEGAEEVVGGSQLSSAALERTGMVTVGSGRCLWLWVSSGTHWLPV